MLEWASAFQNKKKSDRIVFWYLCFIFSDAIRAKKDIDNFIALSEREHDYQKWFHMNIDCDSCPT